VEKGRKKKMDSSNRIFRRRVGRANTQLALNKVYSEPATGVIGPTPLSTSPGPRARLIQKRNCARLSASPSCLRPLFFSSLSLSPSCCFFVSPSLDALDSHGLRNSPSACLCLTLLARTVRPSLPPSLLCFGSGSFSAPIRFVFTVYDRPVQRSLQMVFSSARFC